MAISMDGVKLRKGMKVVVVWRYPHLPTGKTWNLIPKTITRVRNANALVGRAWIGPGRSMYEQIYVDPLKAVAEIRRRNKLAQKK